jgi:hypothetical protein
MRTRILNFGRWALVIVLCWVLIPVAIDAPGAERAATIIGLAGLIGAVILIPVRWFVRIGGREPTWEMRRAKVEVAQIANRVRRNPASVTAVRIQDTIDRIETQRTPETAELCDLLIAELKDFLAGSESWNEAGRRSIRIDELCRELWADDMPSPDFSAGEATFRWHLYRAFGHMMEAAVADASAEKRSTFSKLRDSLEEFRRDDTYRFIDAVQQSADRWLARSRSDRPWIESFEFEPLGPEGLHEVRRIWGREAAMWGARLDEEDRRALAEDLERRDEQPESESPSADVVAVAVAAEPPPDPAVQSIAASPTDPAPGAAASQAADGEPVAVGVDRAC